MSLEFRVRWLEGRVARGSRGSRYSRQSRQSRFSRDSRDISACKYTKKTNQHMAKHKVKLWISVQNVKICINIL